MTKEEREEKHRHDFRESVAGNISWISLVLSVLALLSMCNSFDQSEKLKQINSNLVKIEYAIRSHK